MESEGGGASKAGANHTGMSIPLMHGRCILCDGFVSIPRVGVPVQEDPDLVCRACRARSPEERAKLREGAIRRLLVRAGHAEANGGGSRAIASSTLDAIALAEHVRQVRAATALAIAAIKAACSAAQQTHARSEATMRELRLVGERRERARRRSTSLAVDRDCE